MESKSKEREIPIKILGPVVNFPEDGRIKGHYVPPLVTYIHDSDDEDDSSDNNDRFSIEELESALFSETEEGLHHCLRYILSSDNFRFSTQHASSRART